MSVDGKLRTILKCFIGFGDHHSEWSHARTWDNSSTAWWIIKSPPSFNLFAGKIIIYGGQSLNGHKSCYIRIYPRRLQYPEDGQQLVITSWRRRRLWRSMEDDEEEEVWAIFLWLKITPSVTQDFLPGALNTYNNKKTGPNYYLRWWQ